MLSSKLKWNSLFLLIVSIASSCVYATEAPLKTYQLKNLQRAVSNHENCAPLYKSLQQLASRPIELEFSSRSEQNNFDVKDMSNRIANHSYQIVKQEINGNMVNRVGMGTFELNHHRLEYMLAISADLDRKNYKYTYPIVISGENAHCFYTAMLQPSNETIAAFKKSIQAGAVNKSVDLVGG